MFLEWILKIALGAQKYKVCLLWQSADDVTQNKIKQLGRLDCMVTKSKLQQHMVSSPTRILFHPLHSFSTGWRRYYFIRVFAWKEHERLVVCLSLAISCAFDKFYGPTNLESLPRRLFVIKWERHHSDVKPMLLSWLLLAKTFSVDRLSCRRGWIVYGFCS